MRNRMYRAVLLRFSVILFAALVIGVAISSCFMGQKLLKDNEAQLLNLVRLTDFALDYGGDIQAECVAIRERIADAKARITVIDADGTVLADTDAASFPAMENHVERAEIQEALEGRTGCATRYSETLGEDMLYVAARSADGRHVVRVAVAYTGIAEYFGTIIPALLLGSFVAYMIAAVLSVRFTNTITLPMREISLELQKIHSNNWDFHFKKYKYAELNIISEATMKLSEEVKAHISRLEFEKKVRQEFFSNASHELKTPITAIRGYAELLDNGFVKDEKTRDEFLKKILKSTDNMTQLIEDILMISRLETKDAEVTFSKVHLKPLVREIFESVEPIAAQYEVTLHEECEPFTMDASAKQLRELLMNLVVNGIKYNHPGGNVWVKVASTKHHAVIRVIDDGVGIGEEDQPRVFERFYRVDKGRSRKLGGTGLGLSIVKHIVEYNNGTVRLESALGKGSTFTVTLPLTREP